MAHALESILPLFAPLPGPVVEHLLLGKRRRHRKVPIPPLVSALERETGYSQEEWDSLLQEVRVARQEVFLRMNPLVRHNALSTSWLLQALSGEKEGTGEKISHSTLKEWKNRGLIRVAPRNHPDVHDAAVVLIARSVDRRMRNWLPANMPPDEVRSWCWRQDAPDLPIIPCPLPLTETLGKATLLVTSWPGQAWDPQWRRINSVGAARWFGVREGRWDITLEELRQWDPQAAALDVPFLEEAPDMLQMLATLALIRLAFTRLSQS